MGQEMTVLFNKHCLKIHCRNDQYPNTLLGFIKQHSPETFCGRYSECYCASRVICSGPNPLLINSIITAQSKPSSVLPCQKPGALNNCRLPPPCLQRKTMWLIL